MPTPKQRAPPQSILAAKCRHNPEVGIMHPAALAGAMVESVYG